MWIWESRNTLHMLMHMPTHPDCSRYLHFLIWTPLRQILCSPSKFTSTSFVSRGPTSHRKNMAVIDAFVSADHCGILEPLVTPQQCLQRDGLSINGAISLVLSQICVVVCTCNQSRHPCCAKLGTGMDRTSHSDEKVAVAAHNLNWQRL